MALMLFGGEALGADPGHGVFAPPAAHSSSRIKTTAWIHLHRVDGEIVYINLDHIVFVTSAKNTGGNERAKSRIQLVNGFSDVLETVDHVMKSIAGHDPLEATTGRSF
jgi:hypothetical protein